MDHWIKTAMRLALGRRLPITRGQLAVAGPQHAIVIKRDRFGVPHIFAENDDDASFGLGFCHGQDRTFQLEILARLARGTLAELVGRPALDVDRLSRRLGFWQSGRQRVDVLPGWVGRAVKSYSAGVNAGWQRGLSRLPHEFALLRAKPTPFETSDVLAILTMESFFLSSNWDAELARLLVVAADGPEALEQLDPAYPHWHAVSAPPGGTAGHAVHGLRRDLGKLATWVGMVGASNAWALSPSRTKTDRAMLANDPHLAPMLPAHWYLCHLETPDWSMAGASFVGGAGVPAGHNGHAAWGVTAGLADITDLYLEQLDPDGKSVRGPDGFEPCQVRSEVIGIKGEEPVTEEVLVTPRGPIIGPAVEGQVDAVSIQATWQTPKPVEGFLGLHRTKSFADFRARMAGLPGASFGMVYADADGHIGYLLAGEVPVRLQGDGTIPLPGWEAGNGWAADPVPPEDMPHLLDPEEGYVATANNKPSAAVEPWFGIDFIDGYRVSRISEALAGRRDWDVTETMELQLDVASIPWREVRTAVLGALAGHPRHGPRQLLEEWDGTVSTHSTAAALYEMAMTRLHHRIVSAKAPRAAEWLIGRGFNPALPYNLMGVRGASRVSDLVRRRPEGWFENGWDDAIAQAVTEADQMLRDPDGAIPTWGELRPLVLRHPLAQRPALEGVFNLGPMPWQGDAYTVSQAGPDPFDPSRPITLAIASMRMTIDLGRWDRCRFVLPGGQSGNPFSPHYSDQLRLWLKGDGIPIPIRASEVDEITHRTLRLVPVDSNQPTADS